MRQAATGGPDRGSGGSRPRIVVGPPAGSVRGRRIGAALLVLLALGGGGFGTWSLLTRDAGGAADQGGEDQALVAARAKIKRLEQRIAILERGGEVTELANRELRAELVRMQAELASLTDEVGFYQRLIGTSGSDRGLAVHALKLRATASERVFRFELTLSQNLKQAEQVAGRLELTVEGVRADRATVLDQASLGVRMDDDRSDYAFKYFQQLRGSFELPSDFHPQRVIVSLFPNDKTPQVAQSFAWTELIEEIKDV